jgi:hypothetical protein
MCGVWMYMTYIKQKEIAKKFSFHRFPKARHRVSQIIRKEWIVRCRRKLRLQRSTFTMMKMGCKAAHHSHHSLVSLNASKERSDFKENAEEHKNHRNSFQKKLRNGTCTQRVDKIFWPES